MSITFTVNYSFSGRRCPCRQQGAFDDRPRESQYQAGSVFQRCSYGYDVYTCVYMCEYSYVYKYLYFYCISKNKNRKKEYSVKHIDTECTHKVF
jgi:hypothetical protein